MEEKREDEYAGDLAKTSDNKALEQPSSHGESNLDAVASETLSDNHTISANPELSPSAVEAESTPLKLGPTLVVAIILAAITFFISNFYDTTLASILGLVTIPYVFVTFWMIAFVQARSLRNVAMLVFCWMVGAGIFAGVLFFKISSQAAVIGFLVMGVIGMPMILGIWALNAVNQVPASAALKSNKFVELENMSANGGALGAFVLGLWTVVGALITSWSFINGLIGLMLGFWGLSSKRRWLAGIGIVLSAIGALMCMVDISTAISDYFAPTEEIDF